MSGESEIDFVKKLFSGISTCWFMSLSETTWEASLVKIGTPCLIALICLGVSEWKILDKGGREPDWLDFSFLVGNVNWKLHWTLTCTGFFLLLAECDKPDSKTLGLLLSSDSCYFLGWFKTRSKFVTRAILALFVKSVLSVLKAGKKFCFKGGFWGETIWALAAY